MIKIAKPPTHQKEEIEAIHRMSDLDHLKAHYKQLYNIEQDQDQSNETNSHPHQQ